MFTLTSYTSERRNFWGTSTDLFKLRYFYKNNSTNLLQLYRFNSNSVLTKKRRSSDRFIYLKYRNIVFRLIPSVVNAIKLFTSVIYECSNLARVFVNLGWKSLIWTKHFRSLQKFVIYSCKKFYNIDTRFRFEAPLL